MSSATLMPAITNAPIRVARMLLQPATYVTSMSTNVALAVRSEPAMQSDETRDSFPPVYLYRSLAPFATDWYLQKTLALELEIDDGNYIFSDAIFAVYGVGESPAEALRDYVTSLVELYQIVENDVRNGVPYTVEEFARLNQYLLHL